MGIVDSLPRDTKHKHKVQLVSTSIGPNLPGVPQAFHTSVVVDSTEYTFSRCGIVSVKSYQSHLHLREGGPESIIDIGSTGIHPTYMAAKLRRHFREKTYDLLRKNCNSFSDCAMFLLLGQRLDAKYFLLEQLATSADSLTGGLVTKISLGDYRPNPRADGFSVEEVILCLQTSCPGTLPNRAKTRTSGILTCGKPMKEWKSSKDVDGDIGSRTNSSVDGTKLVQAGHGNRRDADTLWAWAAQTFLCVSARKDMDKDDDEENREKE